MNKLIDDTMSNAADIMDSRITINQSIIDTLVRSPMKCDENDTMIETLRQDNKDLMAAIEIIRSGRQWI